jgi:hypothetical protein
MKFRQTLQSLREVLSVLLNVALVVCARNGQASRVDRVTVAEELALEYSQRSQLVGRKDCQQPFYQCPLW